MSLQLRCARGAQTGEPCTNVPTMGLVARHESYPDDPTYYEMFVSCDECLPELMALQPPDLDPDFWTKIRFYEVA